MLQLKNKSPFEPAIALFPNQQGIDTLYVVIKATFQIGEKLSVAEEQAPVTMADEYWGEPGESSLRYASDMHLGKPSTDVALIGCAWAKEGTKVEQVDVRLAVADREKTIRVFGNRKWSGGVMASSISPPQPFECLPIMYERAYGGIHEVNAKKGKILAEERNPVGVGFRGKRSSREMSGKPLPNIEDPKKLIKNSSDEVTPVGFGFVAPSWLPRRSFAGTYDEAWQKKTAPYLPKDFDPKFFNAANPDFVFDRYLDGGEPVELVNASRKGSLRFKLPRCDFDVNVKIAGKDEKPSLNLETVIIEPDDDRLCMVWRTQVECDKKALKVEEITVNLQSMALNGEAS